MILSIGFLKLLQEKRILPCITENGVQTTENHYISYFPMLTNYENFMKASNDGTLVKLCFRLGKEHDSQAFADITEGLEGIFVTDAMPWFLPYFNSVTKLEF